MRRPSDQQLSEVEKKLKGSIKECPTCFSVPDEYGNRLNGTYKWQGQEYPCDCKNQLALRRAYLAANIPTEYHPLSFPVDFTGSKEILEAVLGYLNSWPRMKSFGIGLELGGKTLGTGKTFGATYIAKELVKLGEEVYFVEFEEILNFLRRDDLTFEDRLRDIDVLIIDDLKPPYTEKQKPYFAERLETILRHRTNWDGVSIITTNLLPEQIEEHYPRVYSLLKAKQIRIDFSGEDYRDNVGRLRFDAAVNTDESRPLC